MTATMTPPANNRIQNVLGKRDASFNLSTRGLDELTFTRVNWELREDFPNQGLHGMDIYNGSDGNIYATIDTCLFYQEQHEVHKLTLAPSDATLLPFLSWAEQYVDFGPGENHKVKKSIACINDIQGFEDHWKIEIAQ